MKPEAIIENYLVKECKKLNILCYKFTSPGKRGVPDRILINNGKIIFVELKSKKGKPSFLQISTIKKMKEHGATVILINDKNDIDMLLKQLIK